ncbi:MAG: ABATE domain-containing protein [Acetobacteraceae bacterium]|nr:ABATE domain-containing protein [Acetobacteraceae bacterium]
MGERAGSLPLVGGELCLDFCNTTSGRGSPDVIEHLDDYGDVLRWAAHAGVMPQDAVAGIRFSLGDAEKMRLLRRTLDTREAVRAVLEPIAKGTRPSGEALRSFNVLVTRAYAGARIVEDGSRLAWRFPSPDAAPDALMGAIVRSAATVATERDPARLKICPGRGCGWLFYDMTKNGGRVWCEMQVCGSRAKAYARYRQMRARREAADEI